jgi:hypothetical protein
MIRKSVKPIELTAIVPCAPMRWPDVDVFVRYGIDPIGSLLAHREHQGDDIATRAQLKRATIFLGGDARRSCVMKPLRCVISIDMDQEHPQLRAHD